MLHNLRKNRICFKIWFDGKPASSAPLAMKALNIKENDEVITPALNFGTAVSSIIIAGAKPIFVDIDLILQIDANKIEEKITRKLKLY